MMTPGTCTLMPQLLQNDDFLISKTTVYNIEEITWFLCSVSFLNYVRMHALIADIIPIYEQFFSINTERAIYLINFDFMTYICGMDLWENRKPLIQQEKTANIITNIDWIAIRDILYFISYFDSKKFISIIKQINLYQLSEMAKYSWNRIYEISLIFDCLAFADTSVAKNFLAMNKDRITLFTPVMITVDPKSVIRLNKEKNVKIELFVERR